jgi:serine protease Do
MKRLRWLMHRLKEVHAPTFLALCVGLISASALTSEIDIRRDVTVAAIERVMPSVVNIATSQLVRQYDDPYEVLRRRFYGLPPKADNIKEKLYNIGSGVIIDEAGDEAYILTNFHVVNGANRVQVQLMDGRVYEAEQLVPTALKDLTLLRIVRQPGEKGFTPIRFAEDDDLLLGETVITVGNPFGLGGSVSRGILSSKNRRTGPEGSRLGFEDWLQTDADINPGNSGGPLVNLRGELIGVNVAVYNEGEGKGTGFAIPVKQISAYLSDFFSLEYTANLWLGARIKGTPPPLTVREVQTNGPAFRAGLRIGQQIVEVNGKPVTSLVQFCKLVASKADNTASITVIDHGVRTNLQAALLPLTDLNRLLLNKRLGLATQPLTEAQAASLQIKQPAEGLVVSEVEKDSPAERAQFQAGMILTAVDNFSVADLVKVAMALGNKKPGERVQLTVIVPRRMSGGYIPFQQGIVTVPVR